MKFQLIIIVIFFSVINVFSQENKELKKIKCLKRMPITCEKLQKNDTIYILYHKSNLEDLNKIKLI